ncbi:MAG TPA: nickel pincer cofactor biosynthesis protein LarC [Longimicrobiales bacterium]|nr:nickel pincer cofactor biosynthesis protein LarC [Longimicrobiales bacterium]
MRALIFDPFAGISGDMTLAALLDLGLEEEWLRDFVRDLGIADVEVHIERVLRRGIAAPHIHFSYPPEKAHRHLRHVVEIIDRVNADARARELATDAFRRVAEAEARVHGTTIEKVHFHEVGATDAILDIVCSMAAVTHLGFDTFFTRPVAVGSGWVDIEHGRYPVPAPATLGILQGLPLTGADLAGECTTPTGAAILATLTGGRAAPSAFTPGRIGFGAGTRDPQDRPNVLRLYEAEVDGGEAESLWLVQADIDDMTPEYAAAAQQALLEAGAADVVIQTVSMKKGRPAFRIEVLAEPARLDALERVLFLATTTLGVRRWPVQRTVLPRETETREWRGQPIRWKRVTLPDGTSRAKPEYQDIVDAALALGLTPFQVRTALSGAGEGPTDGTAGGAGAQT